MSDTQARLDAIRGALRTADNASPGYPAWSEAMYALDALAAELERVTAALRRIADESWLMAQERKRFSGGDAT
jgi:hypothetical protein